MVDVALDVADKDGLRAVTLGRVARELGCHVTSLYTHIESIDDLLERMALRTMDELTAELWAATEGADGDAALRAVACVHRAYSSRHPGRIQAVHESTATADATLAHAALRLAEPTRAVLRARGLTDEQVVHAHRIFSAMLRGFVQGEAAGAYVRGGADATFEHLVALFLVGLDDETWPGQSASTTVL